MRRVLVGLLFIVGPFVTVPACAQSSGAERENDAGATEQVSRASRTEPSESSSDQSDEQRNYSPADQTPRVRKISRDAESSTGEDESAGGQPREDLTTEELEKRARERELGGRDYPLHDHPREVSGEVDCPDVDVIEYEGEVISYNRTAKINRRFRKRLVRFEKIVRDVANEVYGRPPDRIVQLQSYECKTVGGDGEELSEHAFGHAIDVAGFDFENASRDVSGKAAESFEVRLADHWNASGGFAAKHSVFLKRLAEELERRGPFSGMLGPGYPNHDEIFHFDFGPEFFFRLTE